MEKKSWLWKRKSSDRSPGETESSTSVSSHSESNSDEKVPNWFDLDDANKFEFINFVNSLWYQVVLTSAILG